MKDSWEKLATDAIARVWVLEKERDDLIRQLCEDQFSFTSWLQGLVSGAAIIGAGWGLSLWLQ